MARVNNVSVSCGYDLRGFCMCCRGSHGDYQITAATGQNANIMCFVTRKLVHHIVWEGI